MRALRILVAIALLTALPAVPGLAGDRDAQKAAFREVIALEKEAADNIPFDFETAKQKLEEAATKLDGMDVRGDLKELATAAAALDRYAISQIEFMLEDGEVTPEEMEALNWILRQALADKAEALDVIRFFDILAGVTEKKRTPSTPVQPPNCQTQDQQVRAQSTCFTLDIWKINIAKNARAATCKFVDANGDRVTNLRPLFEDVIQDTTCRLTDKTVTVNGVQKRVVRATLKLTTLSKFNPNGSANVRVTAFWR